MPDYLESVNKELAIRKSYLSQKRIDTIYLGGGTPSLLSAGQANDLFNGISRIFNINPGAEITMEANPDDLELDYLKNLKSATPVNRLSIGVQSLQDRDLKLLSRRHTAEQALTSIQNARKVGFDNISIDLIYGIPGMETEDWKYNLQNLPEVEHISAYHLTIEPGTTLSGKVKSGLLSIVHEDASTLQFRMLQEYASKNGYIHYEISNLARKGFESKHNSNYWNQNEYMGIGPSAHSYDINSRQWNIRDTRKYIKAIQNNEPFFEKEVLGIKEKFNEYLMLSLRTNRGVDDRKILNEFGEEFLAHFKREVKPFVDSGYMTSKNGNYTMTSEGWLISDYIVSGMIYL